MQKSLVCISLKPYGLNEKINYKWHRYNCIYEVLFLWTNKIKPNQFYLKLLLFMRNHLEVVNPAMKFVKYVEQDSKHTLN